MNLKIEEVVVYNFKSIKKEIFKLSDFTAFVGYNNAGKSNILEAISWLLKKSSLKGNDFNNKEEPVIVEGKISGITEDFLSKLGNKHRNSISSFVINETLQIQRIQSTPNESSSKIKLNIKSIDEENVEVWKPNPAGIDNAIKFLFPEPIHIKAMDNSVEDVGKNKSSTTIGKLISEILTPIQKQYGDRVQDAMKGIKAIFDAEGEERAPELKAFDKKTNEKLEVSFPGVQIKLHIPTPELKQVFQSGTIKVYENKKSRGKDIGDIGTGAQRSIQMALIRQLAEVKQTDEEELSRTLLLIDEPELYLHPQAIEQTRVALKELTNEGYQVLFTTHSPIMVTSDDIGSAILIRKSEEKGTYCRKRIDDAIIEVEQDAQTQVELLFNLSNSSQILFSEKVLLTEGKTEHKVLPKVFEAIENKTLGLYKYALVNQGSVSSTKKSMDVLKAMDLPTKAIVDLDFAFNNAVKNGFLEKNDDDLKICKDVFSTFESEGRVVLNNGNPTNKGKTNDMLTVKEAFEEMAADVNAVNAINRLHDKLKNENIWLWKKGYIETHCGLEGKNEKVWSSFAKKLKDDGYKETLPFPEEIKELIEWIKE